MTINEIAKRLLDLRENRMTGFIMAGVLREELGFEGYGEALRRRWIEADMEQSGMMTISNNLNVIGEIRQLAAECKAKCGTCGKEKCSCEGRCDSCKGEKCTCESIKGTEPVKEDAHMIAQSHAFRKHTPLQEYATLGLGRTGDAPETPVPGLGAQSAAAPTHQTQPQAAPTTPGARPQPVGIGSDVAVVENGRQYVGKVSRTLPDGKYEISFAGDQPSVRRPYDKTEVTTAASATPAQ